MKKARTKLTEQGLRVVCALSLVLALVPIGGAFAIEGTEEPATAVAPADVEVPAPTEPPATPEPEGEVVEPEPELEPEGEVVEPGDSPTVQESLESLGRPTVRTLGATPDPDPESEGSFSTMDSTDKRFYFKPVPIEITGESPQEISPKINLIDREDEGTGEGHEIEATIDATDLTGAGAKWDWGNATLEGFEDGVSLGVGNISWSSIEYAHYKGNIEIPIVNVDDSSITEAQVEALLAYFSVTADDVEIPSSFEFSFLINFDPTVTVASSGVVDFASDEPGTYWVNSDPLIDEGASFNVSIKGVGSPYSEITSAKWELLDASDVSLADDDLSLLNGDFSDGTDYPLLSTLQTQKATSIELTGTLPALNNPPTGLKLKISVTTAASGSTPVTSSATLPVTIKDDTDGGPDISLTASTGIAKPYANPDKPDYYYEERTIILTIKDNNLKAKDDYSAPNGWSGPTLESGTDSAPTELSFEQKLEDEDDGEYLPDDFALDSDYVALIKDEVGNSADPVENEIDAFMIDNTPPTATILPPPDSNPDFLERSTVTLSGTDALSGTWKYQYKAISLSQQIDDNTNLDALLSGASEVPFPPDGSIPPVTQSADESLIYVLKVWDQAGNVGYRVSDGIIVDTRAPYIIDDSMAFTETTTVLGETPDGPVNDIYNHDVEVTFKARDEYVPSSINPSLNTASGLSGEARYELSYLDSNGDPVANPRPSGGPIELVSPSPPPSPTWGDIQANLNDPWEFKFTIDRRTSDLYPKVKITVFVKDNAGHESAAYSEIIAIDNTAPTVNVSYDNTDVVNTAAGVDVFEANRIATVTVTDLNFDPDAISIESTRTHHASESDGGTGDQPVSWLEDPLDWPQWTVSDRDNTKASTVIPYGADGDYTLKITQVTDLAGNQATIDYEDDFVIDKTLPVITIKYVDDYNESSLSIDDAFTFFHGRTVTVTVTDAGGFNDPDATYKIRLSQDEATEEYSLTSLSAYALQWTGNLSGNALSTLVDGVYDFSGITTTAVDRALRGPNGHAHSPDSDSTIDAFTIDSGAPDADIKLVATPSHTIEYNPRGDGSSYTYPDERSEQTLTVELSGWDDDGSGVWKYQYFRVTPESVANIPNSAAFADLLNDFAPGAEDVTVSTDETRETRFATNSTQGWEDRYIYVLQVIDKAGNTSYLVSNGMIVDTTDPTVPEIEFQGENDNPYGIFTGDVTVVFTANDREAPASTGNGIFTASGLVGTADYVVEYVKPDDSLEPITQASSNTSPTIGANPTWADIQGDLTDAKSFAFPISGETDEYQKIRVTVTVTDRAGNTSTASRELSIDNTNPQVVVSYDNDAAENDRYFKAGRVANLKVTDLNFDSSLVQVATQKTASWGAPYTGDRSTAGATGSISYPDDGEYTLDITGTDKAGNPVEVTYEGVAPQDFVVDLTMPVLSIAYDNNNARNDRYYDAGRTGTITVVEQNFSDAGATVSATLDGAAFSSGGAWSSSGTTHNSSIAFSTDGDYTLSASYTDLAGNPANVVPDDDFVVDLTVPTIEFGQAVQDRTAYVDVVTPEVLFRDRNYDSNGKTITIEGYKNKQVSVSVGYSVITDGEQGTVSDLEHLSSNDDVYVLTATLTDLAGNETTETIMYSVNRFGSTWYLDGTSKDLVDSYYSNTSQEVQIHEVNVNEVIEHTVSLSHDGDLATLSESGGYRVLASGDEASWKEYVYALDAGNFQDEGLYEVTVHTTDGAQNTSSNVSPRVAESACPVNFVIDKTAPTIVLTGVEEGGRYAEDSRTALIDVQDNTAVDKLDVYLNESAAPVASYSGDEVKGDNGQVQYVIQSSNTPQTLAVVARDVAGNSSDQTALSDIFISSSNIMIAGLSVPRVAVIGGGIALGVLILAAAGLLLFAKRRKKREETSR